VAFIPDRLVVLLSTRRSEFLGKQIGRGEGVIADNISRLSQECYEYIY